MFILNIFFFINVGIRTNLHVPRLIPRALKLTIMYAFSDHKKT
jgi:Kef-type K+ transport system membrane component KefB